MYDSETNGLTCSPGAECHVEIHMSKELGSACKKGRPFRRVKWLVTAAGVCRSDCFE